MMVVNKEDLVLSGLRLQTNTLFYSFEIVSAPKKKGIKGGPNLVCRVS